MTCEPEQTTNAHSHAYTLEEWFPVVMSTIVHPTNNT